MGIIYQGLEVCSPAGGQWREKTKLKKKHVRTVFSFYPLRLFFSFESNKWWILRLRIKINTKVFKKSRHSYIMLLLELEKVRDHRCVTDKECVMESHHKVRHNSLIALNFVFKQVYVLLTQQTLSSIFLF